MQKTIFITLLVATLIGCQRPSDANKELPILGERELVSRTDASGQLLVDTVYPTIPPFRFMDQDSNWVTNETFKGKVYLADFFFTTCPTICPVMKKEMVRVAEHFKNEPQVAIISHTIDPDHDSIPVLKTYAEQLGANPKQWHFVWGNRDLVYTLAEKHYYSAVQEDKTQPGGFVHSGGFILVDKNRHVRGIYDGTSPTAVDSMMRDIQKLLVR